MKTLYFDCSSGISGDMTVASLISLGVPESYLQHNINKLNLNGFSISTNITSQYGISATKFDVSSDEEKIVGGAPCTQHEPSAEHKTYHSHSHRKYKEIIEIINTSRLDSGIKALSNKIFDKLASAESKIHNTPVDEVSLHEVGAIDSIIDIVSTAICINYIKPDSIAFSPLSEGCGRVHTAHGSLPIPVPATLAIINDCGAIIQFTEANGEMITPTGAAIASALGSSFGNPCPAGKVLDIGYGAGSRDFGFPNILRTFLVENMVANNDRIIEIRAAIDDMSGEQLSFAAEVLFRSGVKDIYFTPIFMKKGRPAYELTVICSQTDEDKIIREIFRHTTTIGVRKQLSDRIVMDREKSTMNTDYGIIEGKRCTYEDVSKTYPEFESVKELALQQGLSFQEVLNSISNK